MNQKNPFQLAGTIKLKGLGSINQLLEKGIEKTTRLSRLKTMYQELPETKTPQAFLKATLTTLDVNYSLHGEEIGHLPKEGGVVIVANHPYGGLEGIILADLLLTIRPDVKIIANQFLSRVSNISELFIEVDAFGGKQAIKNNHKSVKEAYQWVKDGGMLVVFPAGEVSHLQLRKRMITDPEWKSLIGRIVQKQKAPVVPIRFQGSNSKIFQLAGLLHPRLRTIMLPHEMLNKREKTIKLRIGEPIDYRLMQDMNKEEIVRYLRMQTYLLGNKSMTNAEGVEQRTSFPHYQTFQIPVATEQPSGLIEEQIRALSAEQLVVRAGDMSVFIATADQVPNVVQEIGRLREISFRAVGEGTGKAVDLDLYDNYYQHLFIWDNEHKLLVGSYRLGKTDEIIHRYGKKGLYSHSLFKYKKSLMKKINPGLELGRSFIRPEYQKSYAPLMLLWKGIGAYVAKNPEYHILFGAVSISDDYHQVSQKVLIDYLSENKLEAQLAKYVKPRNKFKYTGERQWQDTGFSDVRDLDVLSDLIMRVEGDQKGVPILLKQYLKLGGSLLGFNVDDQFNNVLDGLIIIDLKETEEKVLSRYMGKSEAKAFLSSDGQTKIA